MKISKGKESNSAGNDLWVADSGPWCLNNGKEVVVSLGNIWSV